MRINPEPNYSVPDLWEPFSAHNVIEVSIPQPAVQRRYNSCVYLKTISIDDGAAESPDDFLLDLSEAAGSLLIPLMPYHEPDRPLSERRSKRILSFAFSLILRYLSLFSTSLFLSNYPRPRFLRSEQSVWGMAQNKNVPL